LAIAKAWAAGRRPAHFQFQGERLKENVEEWLASSVRAYPPFSMRRLKVTKRSPISLGRCAGAKRAARSFAHSVDVAPKEALEGDFVSTTREAFRTAHDISAYSLVALAREAAPLMTNGGSILAMTTTGREKSGAAL